MLSIKNKNLKKKKKKQPEEMVLFSHCALLEEASSPVLQIQPLNKYNQDIKKN